MKRRTSPRAVATLGTVVSPIGIVGLPIARIHTSYFLTTLMKLIIP